MNQGFAVVDFETTGLSPAKGDRAIEIGLVHVAPDGTLEDEHETLIHVDRSVGASWVHHITARDLLHAPDFEGIAHELRDLLAGRVFVAHNVSFDSRFLLAEYSRMGASIPVHQSTMLCTMKLSRSLIGRGKLSDCCDYFASPMRMRTARWATRMPQRCCSDAAGSRSELARLPASSRIGRGCRGTVAHIRRIAERAMAAAWYARRGARQLTFRHWSSGGSDF